MRLPNEQSGSSSLFAHPAAFAAVPLTPQPGEQEPAPDTPDERLRHAVRTLVEQAVSNAAARSKEEVKQLVCDHQALLARWYFRPQNKREGELLFASPSALQTSENGPAHPGPNTGPAEAGIALKPLLRASARVYKSHVERHAPAQVTPTV